MAQADAHYQTSLLRHYGFKPWCKLVNVARQNMQVGAAKYYFSLITCTCIALIKEITDYYNMNVFSYL